MYGIVNDFTPEEEAQIKEENRWAEEAINWWKDIRVDYKLIDFRI